MTRSFSSRLESNSRVGGVKLKNMNTPARIFLTFLSLSCVDLWAQALCVKAVSASLRTEPRSTAAISWTVGRYTPFLKLDRKGPWYKVQDMDGEAAWLHRDSVSSELKCLMIRVSTTNLRQGPGKQYPLVDRPVADKYTALRRLENEEEWYQVEDPYGVRGWIHESNIWRPTVVQSISF